MEIQLPANVHFTPEGYRVLAGRWRRHSAGRGDRRILKSVAAVFWIYPPLILAALGWGVYSGRWGWLAAEVAGGLAAWTVIEYLMHRYAFHGFAPHYQHHADPVDTRYIVAPLWFSSSVAVLLLGILRLATGSWADASFVGAGVLSGYLLYETVHLRIHSPAAGGRLLRAWRKHHYYHHFADDRTCYGVTSPVWDAAFGSLPAGKASTANDSPGRA
jgi:cyclopropane-fatty-acyl-phospholipid synthase